MDLGWDDQKKEGVDQSREKEWITGKWRPKEKTAGNQLKTETKEKSLVKRTSDQVPGEEAEKNQDQYEPGGQIRERKSRMSHGKFMEPMGDLNRHRRGFKSREKKKKWGNWWGLKPPRRDGDIPDETLGREAQLFKKKIKVSASLHMDTKKLWEWVALLQIEENILKEVQWG